MAPDFDEGLAAALHAARTKHGNGWVDSEHECPMCIAIRHAKPWVKSDLREAAAGKLSVRALHAALRASGVRIDRMTIQKHRNEGHTP